MNFSSDPIDAAREEVCQAITKILNGISLDYHIKNRPDGDFLVFEIAEPSSRFYSIINAVNDYLHEEHLFKNRLSLARRVKRRLDIFNTPEILMLRRELAQSLTVNRNSFQNESSSRYIPSVSNYEGDIVGNANFIVYGRRGAGKSSLLAYAMNELVSHGKPTVWVSMQTYSSRDDSQAICSVMSEIFGQAKANSARPDELEKISETLQELGEIDDSEQAAKKLSRLTARLRTVIGGCGTAEAPLSIFLDDFHVLKPTLQPTLLSAIYSISRDNNVYIKISGIEALTRTWDDASMSGMQSPHDIQIMRLDYNLTMPDRSEGHIRDILDSHARYCGLPGISYIADDSTISRLVLAAAAVPRDALSLFSQAINKSFLKSRKTVSITSINAAASESIEEKLKDFQQDLSSQKDDIRNLLEKVKDFCISEQKNAFLVKIDNRNPGFSLIQKLAALRFAHVLHEGTTPHKAGERYMALMLDFGFYVGVRTARSVELFLSTPRIISAKEVRKLPIFHP